FNGQRADAFFFHRFETAHGGVEDAVAQGHGKIRRLRAVGGGAVEIIVDAFERIARRQRVEIDGGALGLGSDVAQRDPAPALLGGEGQGGFRESAAGGGVGHGGNVGAGRPIGSPELSSKATLRSLYPVRASGWWRLEPPCATACRGRRRLGEHPAPPASCRRE